MSVAAQATYKTRKGNDDEKMLDAGIGDCGRFDGDGAKEAQNHADAANSFSWVADQQLCLRLQSDVASIHHRVLECYGLCRIRTESQAVLDEILGDVCRERVRVYL